MKPIVSIIVCTFNRAEVLPYCLDSLANQNALLDQYEIIVINNNSSDTTQDIVDRYTSRYRNIKMILEQQQGLSHARNTGWKKANSDWVAYIDDDAKAIPGYVERLFHVIKTYPFDCFGGVYIPWYKYQKPRWFKDEYASNITVQDHTGVLVSGYVSGGNFAVKKTLLEEFSGFQPDLGMRPGKIAYGEETLLQMKIRDAGYTIGFDPLLIVEHLVSKEKLSPWWQIKSAYARSRDYAKCAGPSSSYSLLKTGKTLLHDFLYYTRRATPRLLLNEYYWQNWVMDVFRPLASHLGGLESMLSRRNITQ